jgi:chaperone modulatory protein CbpM
MKASQLTVLHCQVVEEDVPMSLAELCRACNAERELVLQLVEHGVIEPDPAQGAGPQAWVFAGTSLQRTRVALRLLHDLELNLQGAALAVDLLDEIARLQRALQAASGASRQP